MYKKSKGNRVLQSFGFTAGLAALFLMGRALIAELPAMRRYLRVSRM